MVSRHLDPKGLHDWLVMPQGSSASPDWFVQVVHVVIKGLKPVPASLDDMIVSDSDPMTHVPTIPATFEHLHKHHLKQAPLRARLGSDGC